jgi:hypothetical protein
MNLQGATLPMRIEKKDLEESPFVKFFKLGANNEGCAAEDMITWGHSWKTVLAA